MTKPVITTRAVKGSSLTWTEGDTNLTNLRDATITVSDGTTSTAIDLNGTITFAAGSGISVDESTGTITISNTQSAGATVLDDLTDVSTDGAMNGYVLTYNSTGSNWVSQMPASGATTLDGLDDVNTTGVSDQQLLSYNNSLMRWEPRTVTAGASELNDLTDVSTDGAMNGYVLTYNSTGSNWVSQMPASGATTLDGLDDVNTTGVSDQQLLSYNNSLMRWEPRTVTAGISDVVNDTTPQLGGSLDVNGNSIVSVSNGNITIAPNGTGRVSLDGVLWPAADGTNGQVLTTNGSGSASWTTVGGSSATNQIILSSTYITLPTGASANSTNTWTLQTNGGVSGVSATTGTFTLPAGNYFFELHDSYASAGSINDFSFYNITDSVSVVDLGNIGSITMNGSTYYKLGGGHWSYTISGSKTFAFRNSSSGQPGIRNLGRNFPSSFSDGGAGPTIQRVMLRIYKV